MILDRESIKIDPKENRLTGTVNVSNVDMKDHMKYHQLLLELNGPIWEAVVQVQFHVQWTHMEEGEKVEVYFFPHFHHLRKNKPK
jgi:hypothetical protein